MKVDHLRRSITQFFIRAGLFVSGYLPTGGIRALGRTTGFFAGLLWPLRHRLRHNLNHALGSQAPPHAVCRYFRRLGHWASQMILVYHRGITGAGVDRWITFDDSVRHLDDAARAGRGVVLATPHWFTHEIIAGLYSRDHHPLTALIREAKTPAQARIKAHWYRSLGIETVVRPRKSSVTADMRQCLRVLRDGKILGITPDLLVDESDGVPVNLFQRRVFLKPGAVALAMYAGAPLVTSWLHWRDDRHVVVKFQPALHYAAEGDRDVTLRKGMQDWCGLFEDHLREHPEDWLFWLDKRWARMLRATPPLSPPPAREASA